MRGLAAKPRLAAAVVAIIGLVLIAVNHQTVLRERNYYPLLLLFGPVCVLLGVAGSIYPKVLNPAGIQSAHQVAVLRGISVPIVLAGLAIGWAMGHKLYSIW